MRPLSCQRGWAVANVSGRQHGRCGCPDPIQVERAKIRGWIPNYLVYIFTATIVTRDSGPGISCSFETGLFLSFWRFGLKNGMISALQALRAQHTWAGAATGVASAGEGCSSLLRSHPKARHVMVLFSQVHAHILLHWYMHILTMWNLDPKGDSSLFFRWLVYPNSSLDSTSHQELSRKKEEEASSPPAT